MEGFSMNFSIITIGSQGDIEPFIALGRRLQRDGHGVRIAAFRQFEPYIKAEGFEYAPLAGDAVEVIRLLIGEQVSPFQYFRNLEKLLDPIKEQFLADIQAACNGADVLLYSLLGSVAWHVADKMGLPCFRVLFFPADPTGEFPAMTAPELPLGAAYNKLTFWGGDLLWSHVTRKLLNKWRTTMGLGKIPPFCFPYRYLHGHPVPTLYPFSSLVAPKPADWDENRYICGYWFRESRTNWQPDQKLIDFLSAGSKPIYVGFGSMVGGSFEQLLDIVIASLRITKQRAVLSIGWGNLAGRLLPEDIYLTGFAPHEWLFSRVAAVIHHGGAGTTAAGLRAGLPAVVVPFGGDQPYWGNRVYQLGVGPEPISRKKLNARNLAAAISQAVGNPAIIREARELGRKLQLEDGVGNAVKIMEQILH
ncbi:MAG TPA: hypothetical protein DDW65_22860 [Firmicutes bacterium]|jgi:sterol 3beta-glucosyltransferase|nr:hypothetical protein [Bacillota bacterium]